MQPIQIDIKTSDKILIIAPHPDDECIGTGGLLAKYHKQCDVLVMTDGACGIDNIRSDKTIKIRIQELQHEMDYVIPHSYSQMMLRDGELMKNEKCLMDYDFSPYDKIFIPWYDDNHPDHTGAFLAIYNSVKENPVKAEFFEYEAHVPFHDTNRYLDITDVIEKKKKLIQFHKSQTMARDYDEIAVSLAKYRACLANLPDGFLENYIAIDLNKFNDNEVISREEKIGKLTIHNRLLESWIKSLLNGNNAIAEFLSSNNVSSVSIYGFSDIGQMLETQIIKIKGVQLVDVFDRRKLDGCISPEHGDKSVDIVIVTAVYYYNEIQDDLKKLGYKFVVSLENVLVR